MKFCESIDPVAMEIIVPQRQALHFLQVAPHEEARTQITEIGNCIYFQCLGPMPDFFTVLCHSAQPVCLEELRAFIREGIMSTGLRAQGRPRWCLPPLPNRTTPERIRDRGGSHERIRSVRQAKPG